MKTYQDLRNNFELLYIFRRLKNPITAGFFSKIQQGLVDSIGNMDVNKRLIEIKETKTKNEETREILVALTYRTRHYSKIKDRIDSIWAIFQEAKDSRWPSDKPKLTFEDYSILYDLARLYEKLKILNEEGLFKDNETLGALYQHSQYAYEMTQYFEAKNAPSPGVLAFHDVEKEATFRGRVRTFFERLQDFITGRFGHASQVAQTTIPTEKPASPSIAHLYPTYKQESVPLRYFLYNDMYCIKLKRLIDKKNQNILQGALGDNWLEQVENLFIEIQRDIHDNSRGKYGRVEVRFDFLRGFAIGMASLFFGHKNWLMRDHSNKDIRDMMLKKGQWIEKDIKPPHMLCSEFLGRTIIATMEELNDRLKKKLEEKGVKNIPAILIENPISEMENLYCLTPTRLLIALQEKGAVEEVPLSPEITHAIEIDPSAAKTTTAAIGKIKEPEPEPTKPLPKPR
jgi:hypothetical protein